MNQKQSLPFRATAGGGGGDRERRAGEGTVENVEWAGSSEETNHVNSNVLQVVKQDKQNMKDMKICDLYFCWPPVLYLDLFVFNPFF